MLQSSPLRMIALLLAILCLPLGSAATAQQPAPNDFGMPLGLELFLFPGATREKYVEALLKQIHTYDRNRDGLTAADIAEYQARQDASARANRVAYYARYDADGDGRVTVADIEATMMRQLKRSPGGGSHTADFWKRMEEEVARLMKADKNGDKVITFDEMQADPETRKSAAPIVTMLLDLDPNKDGRITAEETTKLATEAFDRYDRNGNGSVDPDEATPLMLLAIARSSKKKDACDIPRPAPDEQVIALGIFNGASVASVSVAGQDVMTTAGTLTIEPGEKPIYLFVSAPEILIWQFKGATTRISRAVIVSAKAGVVGLQAQQVHFVTSGSCPSYDHFADPQAIQRLSRMMVEYAIGRRVDLFGGVFRLANLQIPSLAETDPPNQSSAEPGDVDPRIWAEFVRVHPAGVVEIDPAQVVAPDPVERYEVLPGFAGIVQLIRQGTLEAVDERSYRILKPIARFPGAIRAGFAATFRLAKGVPMPQGSSKNFCVISEETGEILVNTDYCQLN